MSEQIDKELTAVRSLIATLTRHAEEYEESARDARRRAQQWERYKAGLEQLKGKADAEAS